MGKCHGTIPGWWLVKNHPEVLIDFCSFFLGPHTKPANSNIWIDSLSSGNPQKMISISIRNIESGMKKKQEEILLLDQMLLILLLFLMVVFQKNYGITIFLL